jgi:hypothetical protein
MIQQSNPGQTTPNIEPSTPLASTAEKTCTASLVLVMAFDAKSA